MRSYILCPRCQTALFSTILNHLRTTAAYDKRVATIATQPLKAPTLACAAASPSPGESCEAQKTEAAIWNHIWTCAAGKKLGTFCSPSLQKRDTAVPLQPPKAHDKRFQQVGVFSQNHTAQPCNVSFSEHVRIESIVFVRGFLVRLRFRSAKHMFLFRTGPAWGCHVSDGDETTVRVDFLPSCCSLAFQVPVTKLCRESFKRSPLAYLRKALIYERCSFELRQ